MRGVFTFLQFDVVRSDFNLCHLRRAFDLEMVSNAALLAELLADGACAVRLKLVNINTIEGDESDSVCDELIIER